MEPTYYISSEFELKVYLFALVQLKMAANYITKGILYVISDILSLITVVLCMVQKVPQIRDLFMYKSAKGPFKYQIEAFRVIRWVSFQLNQKNSVYFFLAGISTTSLLLELFSYTTMTLYNYTYQYAMLSYLEYPILIVQEYILVALVFKYKRMYNQNNMAGIAAYFVIVLLFAYQICPRFLLSMAVVSWNLCSIFLSSD